MKKFLEIVANTGIILLAFGLYSLLQVLYLLPNDFGSTAYQIKVAGIIIVTLLLVGAMWTIYKYQLKQDNPQGFNQKPHFKWRRLMITLLGIVVMMAMQYAYVIAFGNRQPENQTELNTLMTRSTTLFKILVAFVAPVIEEIILRGMLVNTFFRMNTVFSKIAAVILGGLVFGLLHEPRFSPDLLIYWGMGMVLMTVYLLTKDLRYSMLVHIFNNSLSLI